MLPVLFALGPFQLRTFNIFLVVAFLLGLFVFWRKGRENHYDEVRLFDGLLAGTVLGLLVARIGFIVFNFNRFGFSIIRWLDFIAYPGFFVFMLFAVCGLYLYRYANKHKWDAFEVLDFWSLGVTLSLAFIWLGLLFDGTGFGTPTNLPWGVVFPDVFQKHHPTQLYFAIFYFALFAYLARVDYSYRTFSWYRAGKNTAQTGFLLSMFLIWSGTFSLLLSLLVLPPLLLGFVRIDICMSLLVLFLGGYLLFIRSGRTVFPAKKKPSPKLPL